MRRRNRRAKDKVRIRVTIPLRFDERDKNGILFIDNEMISFDGAKSPTIQEYKRGVRQVLLNAKRAVKCPCKCGRWIDNKIKK